MSKAYKQKLAARKLRSYKAPSKLWESSMWTAEPNADGTTLMIPIRVGQRMHAKPHIPTAREQAKASPLVSRKIGELVTVSTLTGKDRKFKKQLTHLTGAVPIDSATVSNLINS